MRLDYLFGRTVKSVQEGDGDAEWCITLDGGATIVNYDPGYAAPDGPALEGLAFTSYDESTGAVRMYFGTNENPMGTVVHLPLDQYGLSDDTFTKGEVVKPGSPEPQQLPPDPEEERRQHAEAEESEADG